MSSKKINSPEKLKEIAEQARKARQAYRCRVLICMTGCRALGASDIAAAFREKLAAAKLGEQIAVVETGCIGLCARAPVVLIEPYEYLYGGVKPDDVDEIIEKTIQNGEPVESLVGVEDGKALPRIDEAGFYKEQQKTVLENCGRIDPKKIEDAIARGCYEAAAKALCKMTPEEVIEEVSEADLRGRGGAGFPTGLKWSFCRKSPGNEKYLICNADEGDPGAFMDRALKEGDPHRVIEGMIIAAYAIGASNGFVYVRAEYPIAVEHIGIALDQARQYGLLGKNILGSGFDFDIEVRIGAGAFVCGEETALIASLEGKRGMPSSRPPFPAQSGYQDKPTNINNVETFANVPLIIKKGAKWYSSIGTEGGKGTKIFALAGKVKNTGLVEVPMGSTLRRIVFDIGGGIPGDGKFKAAQMGGPSGGCVPQQFLDLGIDYNSVKEIGAIMGSGGLIVMDESTCMVDVARYFLQFCQSESCGKCTPCRVGTKEMLHILDNICDGKAEIEDLERLQRLADHVGKASLCGLGQTAPNPVLSTLRYFRHEYEAHIKYKKCPAGVCKRIVSAACQHTCPIEQDVPCYVGLIAQGKFEQAIEIVRRENPLPSICGRVCTAGCEAKCRAGEGEGEGISIRMLKRFLADYERVKGLDLIPRPKNKKPEKVAIVGSGPAGLTCAYYLALEGYGVTIFESLPVIGGMLAVGIPEYRLPKHILDWEIGNIKKLGVEFRTNTVVGKDVQIPSLQKQYKAIFIATGAHKGLKMRIEGEDLPQVIDAVDFLRARNIGKEVEIGQRVAVIGGGDAAIDAARVTKRLGKDVRILYRRTRREMPATKQEIEGAIAEGIEIQFLVAPVRVLSEKGQLKGIECIKMELGEVDSSGRRRPVPIEGSEFTIEIDTLMPAIGQQPDLSVLAKESGLKSSKSGTIEVDPENLTTGIEGIFAGGDVVVGPDAVTAAMAHGKIAAKMIIKYIQGRPLDREYKVTRSAIRVEPVELTAEEIEELRKPEVPMLSPEDRADNFEEVELGFSQEMAIKEAKRCLRCDLELEE